MSSAIHTAQQQETPPSIRFAGRSFVVASNLPPEELRGLGRGIEVRGGTVHPFLNAVTDVLVVGSTDGSSERCSDCTANARRALPTPFCPPARNLKIPTTLCK